MAVPVRHRGCGGLLGLYVGEREEPVVRSRDFQRLDGAQPEYGTQIREMCPKCGELILRPASMQRCFDEVM